MYYYAASKLVPPGSVLSDLAGGTVTNYLILIVNFILYFLAIVTFFAIVYGGYLMLTSGGNEEGVTKGRKVLLGAILGFLIVIISYAVVNTLLNLNWFI